MAEPRDRDAPESVTSLAALTAAGWTWSAVRAQLEARRWQRIGRAVVRHNGPLTRAQEVRVGLANCGPRAVLTAFTAADSCGLTGWSRPQVHVLVPGGTKVCRIPAPEVRVHYTGDWDGLELLSARRTQRLAPALVIAAATFRSPRPACGLFAAAIQQRLLRASDLVRALDLAPRTRHRAALLLAAHDLGQGAQALSEIDFARLCRRHGLSEPIRQSIRPDRLGRTRYLDAEWIRSDGRRVIAEIDGALHLVATRWWDDQLRQNELVLDGQTTVLRFPSVIVRLEAAVVVAQLRKALGLPV